MPNPVVSRESDALWQFGSRWRLAALLIILFREKSNPGVVRVVLTVRSRHLRRYAGDPALPGGIAEHGETWWDTALRESYEEIGFDMANFENGVTKLAALPIHHSPQNLLVRPCVVLVHLPTNLRTLAPKLERAEVESAFSLPLEWFLHAESLSPGSPELVNWTNLQWYYYRFAVKNADWIFPDNAPPPPRGPKYHTTVHGLTAHVLVDVARWFYNKAPDFPHHAEFGWLQGVRLLNEREDERQRYLKAAL